MFTWEGYTSQFEECDRIGKLVLYRYINSPGDKYVYVGIEQLRLDDTIALSYDNVLEDWRIDGIYRVDNVYKLQFTHSDDEYDFDTNLIVYRKLSREEEHLLRLNERILSVEKHLYILYNNIERLETRAVNSLDSMEFLMNMVMTKKRKRIKKRKINTQIQKADN
jgi:hypothetical protein